MLMFALMSCNRPTAELSRVLQDDPRNGGVVVSVDCKEYLGCDNLVFDVEGVTGSPMDVTRVFFQFAHSQRDIPYERVYLASKGVPKFYVNGDYFSRVGKDYPTENPVYLMNHLPENVKNLDGSAAFSTWEGGWLGVSTKQMDDLKTLHDRWWLK
jgi:hypothetical protein